MSTIFRPRAEVPIDRFVANRLPKDANANFAHIRIYNPFVRFEAGFDCVESVGKMFAAMIGVIITKVLSRYLPGYKETYKEAVSTYWDSSKRCFVACFISPNRALAAARKVDRQEASLAMKAVTVGTVTGYVDVKYFVGAQKTKHWGTDYDPARRSFSRFLYIIGPRDVLKLVPQSPKPTRKPAKV